MKTAPTLVKYAAPNEYLLATRSELAQAAAELMKERAHRDRGWPVSIWWMTRRSKSIWRPRCSTAPAIIPIARSPATSLRSEEARRNEIIALGARHRGRHDELLREFSAGQGLRFDILMDIGGFRDMHRHRRCIQILQPFTDRSRLRSSGRPGRGGLAARNTTRP